ncbi:helix-turn-helix transcriptional regulator [Pseudomonas sp. REB1044]|uniref:XRE family transcriptional regulator n=1 Tax=Pseudomonas sp. REB1044 TaxID=2675224 RepID=UPI00315C7118
MKTVAELISSGRKAAGINQSELARRLGITPQSVQAWESGRSKPRAHMLADIAQAIGVSPELLIGATIETGGGSGGGSRTLSLIREMLEKTSPAHEASMAGKLSPWDDETPLEDDEVEVPFLREVELSAGSGRTAVELSSKRKIRFGKLTLRNQGVQFEQAVCVSVHGDSMAPVLPDGSTVGIDTGSTVVRDGKIYALNQNGHLRIKTLYRLPDGGIRLRSFNREEYPDEEYTLQDMVDKDITIIGRVFWSSVLW